MIGRLENLAQKYIGGKKILRSVIYLAAGTAAGQGITFLATPVLTRLFSREEIAEWSIFFSLSALFSVLAGWRYDLAIVIPEKEEKAANVLALQTVITVVMCLCVGLLIALSGAELAGWLGIPGLRKWLWCVPVLVLFTGLAQGLNAWFTRTSQFGAMAAMRFTQSGYVAAGQLGCGFLAALGAGGLVLGYLGGQMASVAGALARMPRGSWELLRKATNRAQMWRCAKEYRNFPLVTAPYSFATTSRDRLLLLLMGIFVAKASIAHYYLVQRMVSLPGSLLSSALNPVFVRRVSGDRGGADFRRFVMQTLLGMALLVSPAAAFGWVFAVDIFQVWFGPGYGEAGVIARLVLPACIITFLTAWMDRGYEMLGKQHISLILQVSFSVLGLAGFVALVQTAGFKGGVIAATGAQAVFESVWMVVLFQLLGLPLARLGWIILCVVVLAAGLGLVMSFLRSCLPFLQALAASGLVATGFYLFSLKNYKTWREAV